MSSLRLSLVFVAGFILILSFSFLISFLRKRLIDKYNALKLLFTGINILLIAYLFVLATNVNLYYFDAPYQDYGSDLISWSSYIPFLLVFIIIPVTYYKIQFLKSNGRSYLVKSSLIANNLVYMLLLAGFGYWGLALKMRRLLLIISITMGFNHVFAHQKSGEIKLLISSRVDTSSEDVKSIIRLYENYYKARPDSIYDNPYWNKKEKELYKDFDFSRASIFQAGMNANSLFKNFSPFVMSVEPIGEKYQIRVLFSSSTTDPKYAGSKVWCIQKLNAVKENQSWVLENLMVELSENWTHKKIGYIDYIYPPKHQFNNQEAERGKSFCHEIIQRFNPGFNDSFKYYITNSKDDMGLLENFDYYFVGITTGKAREGMVLTAKGNEFYPHEFIHKLLPINPKRGHLIEEGLAEFLGTKENKAEYEGLMNKLATDLNGNPDRINFKSVISQTVRFNGYQTAYPAGAGICEIVYNRSGDEGLKKLLHADTKEYGDIVKAVCSITNLTEQELEATWNATIKKY